MIFLILSVDGFQEILSVADKKTDKLWLNKAIVTEDELIAVQDLGWHIHIFSDSINAKSEQSIIKAIKYIEKQWPHDDIEVEYL